jgi:hypothetical protein
MRLACEAVSGLCQSLQGTTPYPPPINGLTATEEQQSLPYDYYSTANRRDAPLLKDGGAEEAKREQPTAEDYAGDRKAANCRQSKQQAHSDSR